MTACCFSGVKGSQGLGLGLHGAEHSSSSLLCLSDVHGEFKCTEHRMLYEVGFSNLMRINTQLMM